MSKKRDKRKHREAKVRAAKYELRKAESLIPPSEVGEYTVEQLRAMLTTATNVIDIPLGLLRIDGVHGDRNPYADTLEGHNRRLKCQGHIRKSNGWNPLACQVLTVCEGDNGFYDILDGGGRLYMADQLSGLTVKTLACRVLKKLTPAAKSALFNIINTEVTKVNKWDEFMSHKSDRTVLGDEVRAVERIKLKFANWPKMTISVIRFLHSLGVLERAASIVANTPFGVSRTYSSIFAVATGVLIGDPHFDEERFRVITTRVGPTKFVYDKAQRRANDLGYPRPHERTIAWLSAVIIAEEYNKGIGAGRKLSLSRLDSISTPWKDAYSSAPPKPPETKYDVIDGGKVADAEA